MKDGSTQEKMHFVIAQTMMKYTPNDKNLYAKARHICLASRLIKRRVPHRIEYRNVLRDAAETAAASGARPTALWYFRHCLNLLQEKCWQDPNPDVYLEAKSLHITTAEMLWSQGQSGEALSLLEVIFNHAKDGVDKSRAWILKSKIYAQSGNHYGAMNSLLTGLDELGVHMREPTSYEECDAAYNELRDYLREADFHEILERPLSEDRAITAIGTVMSEAMAVTYWDDALTFLRMAIEMVKLHLFKGGFSQIAIGFSHLSMISYSRFKDLDMGARLSDLSLALLERYSESWTHSRGYTVHNLYVNHLRVPIRSTLPELETSLESSFAIGDPFMTLISLSSMAMARLYLGQDMAELETFCNETPEDIPDWMDDTRGGASVLAVR